MKKIAKQRLRGVYLYSLIVWLVYMYVTDRMEDYQFALEGYTSVIPSIGDVLPNSIIAGIILWLAYIFIGLPLMGSIQWFFLSIADQQKASWREILEVFTKKNYVRYFVASLIIMIFIGLWSLLLIVPGIIKSFSYSQTFRLMRDNPEMGVMDAITLSRKRMNGRKTELFFLQLSFIVWLILPGILLIVGFALGNMALVAVGDVLFFIALALIGPYFQTTNAVFYVEEIRGRNDANQALKF
ncbi:hypothetical protein PGRAN_09921 [Listeria grandensis FSL F6-0971]|uniref:Integral membrane protein n=1 Tax=Listeria grandensis FSL F6-0971 TaxID=1265819 RepID=W7BB21_9LIST|nr:DUF975 family protein [Listeria grandensis]EUJ23237.1 hypothetical protein PGRAN_09921 [Listeria grandensis FSL F6-0971]